MIGALPAVRPAMIGAAGRRAGIAGPPLLTRENSSLLPGGARLRIHKIGNL
jgi:hypothetical protein